jgi:hypothetical protein
LGGLRAVEVAGDSGRRAVRPPQRRR